MTLTHGVSLTLKHKNNGTNGFPVPENVGKEPLIGFISGQVTEIWHIFNCWWLTMTYLTLIQGVTLTLDDKNNATNTFPVPENLGVFPYDDSGFPTEKKSSGCSLKNINLARASSLTLTLLHKICSMCGCPLSNIWHVFSQKNVYLMNN